jgi:hypothetical protein
LITGGRALGHVARWALLLLPAVAAWLPTDRPAALLLSICFLSSYWLLLVFLGVPEAIVPLLAGWYHGRRDCPRSAGGISSGLEHG